MSGDVGAEVNGHEVVYRAHRFTCLRCEVRLIQAMQFNSRECPGRPNTPSGDVAAGCPTMCDSDCDTPCHEVHQPTAKRTHRPETCGDVGAEVAAVLAARMSRGTSGRWIADYGETPQTLADALAPLIAERVEAAKAEGENFGWQVAHDEACERGRFCSAHQPIAGRRAAALDPEGLPDPRHEGKSPAEWLFAEDES